MAAAARGERLRKRTVSRARRPPNEQESTLGTTHRTEEGTWLESDSSHRRKSFLANKWSTSKTRALLDQRATIKREVKEKNHPRAPKMTPFVIVRHVSKIRNIYTPQKFVAFFLISFIRAQGARLSDCAWSISNFGSHSAVERCRLQLFTSVWSCCVGRLLSDSCCCRSSCVLWSRSALPRPPLDGIRFLPERRRQASAGPAAATAATTAGHVPRTTRTHDGTPTRRHGAAERLRSRSGCQRRAQRAGRLGLLDLPECQYYAVARAQPGSDRPGGGQQVDMARVTGTERQVLVVRARTVVSDGATSACVVAL